MIELASGSARCAISPADGGRIATLSAFGRELLTPVHDEAIGGARHPRDWGCFPMAPWVGRLGHGAFDFDGVTHRVPRNLGDHALHGTVFDRAWDIVDAAATTATLRCALGDRWPLGGSAEHTISLDDDRLRCVLTVTAADGPMPAEVGWHPWFLRPDQARLAFAGMLRRGPDGLPTGEVVEPTPGPWDDCFVRPTAALELIHADLVVTIASDCDHWGVYDEQRDAVCVEPQSGPPDAFSIAPCRLAAGETLTRWMTISWRRRG